MSARDSTTVVVMTRNRVTSLEHTLTRLMELPSRPSVIVVDNASTDGTSDMIRRRFPDVDLARLPGNRGVAARNLGVAIATTELVAFSDDDSWWEAGSLEKAAELFERSPNLGLAAAAIRVGDDGRQDPTCAAMEASPLGLDASGHRRVLGFVACGSVVRRRAMSQVGGFDESLFLMGEEEALALDMAAHGWDVVYAPELVAVHAPGVGQRSPARRRRLETRNGIITRLTRRRPASVLRAVVGELQPRSGASWIGTGAALARLPSLWLGRRPVPDHVERQRRLIENRLS